MIQEGLVSLLLSDSTLTDLCGGRIYPVALPKSPKLPAITYMDVSRTSQNLLAGEGLVTKRIQFDCWSSTYAQAKQLQAVVMSVLNNFSGTLPDGTQVLSTVADTALDFFENASLLYRNTSDFIFVGPNL